MKLSPEHQAEMITATKESAHSLLDDLKHIREILEKFDKSKENDSSGDIRRLSVVLRRLLIYNDLNAVASPRIGKFTILSPQNTPVYQAERARPFLLFISGHDHRIWAYDMGIQLKRRANRVHEFANLATMEKVELTLGSFKCQRVICYRTKWVSREAVIKYVANLGGGAHSGEPETSEEILLSQIRNAGTVQKNPDGSFHLDLIRHGIDNDVTEFSAGPPGLNPVLIEVLSAAKWLANSPSILELERILKLELGV